MGFLQIKSNILFRKYSDWCGNFNEIWDEFSQKVYRSQNSLKFIRDFGTGIFIIAPILEGSALIPSEEVCPENTIDPSEEGIYFHLGSNHFL